MLILSNLFNPGTFTTAIALSTFVYLMMEHPDLQKQLQNEADRHLGSTQNEADRHLGSRTPNADDRKMMPLMEAAILEILRYISHVPLNLPHFTLENTTVGGYTIPKNTQVRKHSMYKLCLF